MERIEDLMKRLEGKDEKAQARILNSYNARLMEEKRFLNKKKEFDVKFFANADGIRFSDREKSEIVMEFVKKNAGLFREFVGTRLAEEKKKKQEFRKKKEARVASETGTGAEG